MLYTKRWKVSWISLVMKHGLPPITMHRRSTWWLLSQLQPCGLPYFSRLFKRGVAMCTGSGIGAVASTCMQHDSWFLIWIGPNLENTYGQEIMQLICNRIPESRRLIWDTRGPLGRPNVVPLLQETYRYWKAEGMHINLQCEFNLSRLLCTNIFLDSCLILFPVALFIGSPGMNSQVLQSCQALKTPVFVSKNID
jgi:hypothetical protein